MADSQRLGNLHTDLAALYQKLDSKREATPSPAGDKAIRAVEEEIQEAEKALEEIKKLQQTEGSGSGEEPPAQKPPISGEHLPDEGGGSGREDLEQKIQEILRDAKPGILTELFSDLPAARERPSALPIGDLSYESVVQEASYSLSLARMTIVKAIESGTLDWATERILVEIYTFLGGLRVTPTKWIAERLKRIRECLEQGDWATAKHHADILQKFGN